MRLNTNSISIKLAKLSPGGRFGIAVAIALAIYSCADQFILIPFDNEVFASAKVETELSKELLTLNKTIAEIKKKNQTSADSIGLAEQYKVLKSKLESLDQELVNNVSTQSENASLKATVDRVLSNHPGVSLAKIDTHPSAPQASASSPVISSMKMDSLEFSIDGSYIDLEAYLRDLEKELVGVRWNFVELKRPTNAVLPRLTVSIFMFSKAIK